jgi:hypothetical protein
MEYDVQTITIDNLPLSHKGALEPLCNTCVQESCTNPVRSRTISVFGEVREWRLLGTYGQHHMVISCAGFVSPDEDEDFEETMPVVLQ